MEEVHEEMKAAEVVMKMVAMQRVCVCGETGGREGRAEGGVDSGDGCCCC